LVVDEFVEGTDAGAAEAIVEGTGFGHGGSLLYRGKSGKQYLPFLTSENGKYYCSRWKNACLRNG
jgi:hypothetical protein